jgi:hypothetical protein
MARLARAHALAAAGQFALFVAEFRAWRGIDNDPEAERAAVEAARALASGDERRAAGARRSLLALLGVPCEPTTGLAPSEAPPVETAPVEPASPATRCASPEEVDRVLWLLRSGPTDPPAAVGTEPAEARSAAIRGKGPVPAVPVEPIVAFLAIVDLESARELLVASARTWLDAHTWRELAALARTDPARCRAAHEAVLARDPVALDRALDGLEVEPTETAPCSKCAA